MPFPKIKLITSKPLVPEFHIMIQENPYQEFNLTARRCLLVLWDVFFCRLCQNDVSNCTNSIGNSICQAPYSSIKLKARTIKVTIHSTEWLQTSILVFDPSKKVSHHIGFQLVTHSLRFRVEHRAVLPSLL